MEVVFIHVPKTAGMAIQMYLSDKPVYSAPGPVRCTKDKKYLLGNHLSIKMALNEVPESCISLAVVRNPWDRAVSLWLYNLRTRKVKSDSFEKWILEELATGEVPNSACQLYYLVDSSLSLGPRRYNPYHWFPEEIIVDHVFRFESLRKDWRKICNTMGTEYSRLPRSGVSKGRLRYREYYTDKSAELIGHMYREDVDRLGYSF